MEHHRRAKEVAGDDHPSARIAALIGLANAARGLGDSEAASFAEQALQLARERSFRLLEGLALTSLADIALAAGDHAEAARHARAALDIHRETGHRLGEAQTLRTLGEASDGTADAYRRQSMELFDEIGSAQTVEGRRAHPESTG
jgi:tetratricopeptide (TPR) repeat protein